MQDIQVMEGAEAFSLGEGPTGVLLIHGFQGTPQGLRELGEHLAAQGMGVAAPRLPGHGTTWQDLNTRQAPEWVETVDRAYRDLSGRCDEVFVLGLSFGAALAIDLVARHPGDIAGLVTLAGWVYTNDPLRFVAPVLIRFVASLPAKTNDIADPDGYEIACDRLPTRAAYEAYKFATKRARSALGQVTCPILVMHGRDDHTIPLRSSGIIHDEVASADKELVIFDRSFHVLTLDYDKQEVLDRTLGFIDQRSKHRGH